MLNIFADALLIASRMGRLPEDSYRRAPQAFQDIEALRTVEHLRSLTR